MTHVEGEVGQAGGARRRAWRIALVLGGIAAGVPLAIAVGLLPPVFGMVALAVVLTTVFWLIRAQLPSILLVFVVVLLISMIFTRRLPKLRSEHIEAHDGDRLAREWKASGQFNDKLPIVLHLIFDELMSPGAMTGDLPGGAEARQTVMEFGQRHSFRMYDSVYSRYFFSGVSIPSMMSSEYVGRTALARSDADQQRNRESNPYFDEMARRGYRTVVFQTVLLDFSNNANVDFCETFDSFAPIGGSTAGLDSRNQRASLWQAIFRAYQPSYTSTIGKKALRRIYGLQTEEVGVLGIADRYDAQGFPGWFDRFARFTAAVPRGTHVFAHFMVPHSPYLLSESCVVSGTPEAGYYLSNYPEAERSAKRQKFYQGYFGQLRCVASKLDTFMSTIEASENFRDAVIVIHGDHGSRISSGNVVEDYTERDRIDNYATFFAVRSPTAVPGVDCEFVSLPEIFRRTLRGGKSGPASGTPLPVAAVSRVAGNVRVSTPMPRFGCAAANAAVPQ
jgi:hypothetical protein